MNYRYNTEMLPRADFLRVCFSCWRKLPSHFSRRISQHKFPGTTSLTCTGDCGNRWSSILATPQRQYCTAGKKSEDFDISSNPFYEKYKKKLKHMQEESPEEFQSKLEDIEKEREEKLRQQAAALEPKQQLSKPEITAPTGARSWPPKSLDEILKVDLVKDLNADAIKAIWQEHHLSKDCIFSVVPATDFDEMIAKSKLNPTFIFPLPKGDGYEFYLSQFDHNNVFFTPLGMFQLLKENAPPCLSVAHFPELKDSKDIVLMAGEYDDKVIKKQEAINLVRQMTLYYGKDAGDRYLLLRAFSSQPDKFDYMATIDTYKQNNEFLETNPL